MNVKLREHYWLVLILATVLLLGIINFFKAAEFLYPDWDGLLYLSYSKNVLLGQGNFLYEVRSVLSVIILPDIFLARVEMLLFHLGIVTLVYLIVLKLTQDKLAAAFSSLLYGLNWWVLTFLVATLTDVPAMFFFLLSFYLWLNKDRNRQFAAGAFAGIAFLLRFDIGLLILPMILFSLYKKEDVKYFLFPLIIIAIPLEIFASFLVHGKLHHPAYTFLQVNFVSGLATTLVKSRETDLIATFLGFFSLLTIFALSTLFYYKERRNILLLLMFLPFIVIMSLVPLPDNRIFFVKTIPILALFAHNVVFFLRDRVGRSRILLAFIILIAIVPNLVAFAQVDYPTWRLDETPCPSGDVCTNIPGAINYFCESPAVDMHLYSGGYVDVSPNTDAIVSIEENIPRCDYILYYKNRFGYNESVDNYLKETYTIAEETDLTVVYSID